MGGLRIAPFSAQGFDHGWQHEAFDIRTRRVVRTKLVAFAGRQRAFEQSAEDRRFDMLPVGARGVDQQDELGLVERQRIGMFE